MTWYTPTTLSAAFGAEVRCEDPGCEVGAGTVFEGSAVLGHDCSIGANCVIGDGFYAAGEAYWSPGLPEPIPSSGIPYDGDWDGWVWTRPTTVGDRCKLGEGTYLVAGTVVGADNDIGYTPRVSWRFEGAILDTGRCYFWGKPTIGARNAFGADCYVWNGAVIGDDNTFDGDCYIGLTYNPDWRDGIGPNHINRYDDARDYGDSMVGSRNTVGHDGYVWGPFAGSSSIGDDNILGHSCEFFGSHVTSFWTIGNRCVADSVPSVIDGVPVGDVNPAELYSPTIIGNYGAWASPVEGD